MTKPCITKYKAYWIDHDPYDNQTLKQCCACKVELERSMFNRDIGKRDGLNSHCRSCNANRSRLARSEYRKHWQNNDPYADTSLKHCQSCDKDLERHDFQLDHNRIDGLQHDCRKCHSIRMKAKHHADPIAEMLRGARTRANKKGIPFAITREHLIIPDFCPVFPWIRITAQGELRQYNSPSLDRIDNTLGYTPDNVQVISYRANSLKSDATADELMLIVEYMDSRLKNP